MINENLELRAKEHYIKYKPMSAGLLHLLIRWQWNACVVCMRIQFKAKIALACVWSNASSINASTIVIFCFRITNRMANMPLTFIVAQPVARIALAHIRINTKSINTFVGTVRFAHKIITNALFETIHTDACLIDTDAINTVTALDIGGITS